MAAIEVLPQSPGGPAPWSNQSTFDDLLSFGASTSATNSSASATTPAAAPAATPAAASKAPASSSEQQRAEAMTKKASSSSITLPPPPAPGSPPEVLFRYYLAAELRRTGSNADDAIIDRYVAQHYPSFAKDIEGSVGRGAASGSSSGAKAESKAATTPARPSSSAVPLPKTAPPAPAPIAATTATLLPKLEEEEPISFDDVAISAAAAPSSAAADFDFAMKLDEGRASPSPFNHASCSSAASQQPTLSINPELMTLDSDSAAAMLFGIDNSASSAAGLSLHRSDGMSGDDSGDDEDVKPSRNGAAHSMARGTSEATSASPQPEGSSKGLGMSAAVAAAADDLRPSPEEYKKLSSKEKRQLRNKISARNFRTRRKEHISTLEQQVADRDAIIEGLRLQLAAVTVQNKELQDEVRSLKAKQLSQSDLANILDALQKTITTGGASAATTTDMAPPALPRTSSSSSLSEFVNLNGAAASSSTSRPPTPSSSAFAVPSSPRPLSPRPALVRRSSPAITTPNTRKDTAPSTSGARAFWGGAASSHPQFMGVHTVLMPQLRPLEELLADSARRNAASKRDADVEGLTQLINNKMSLETSKAKASAPVSRGPAKAKTGGDLFDAFEEVLSRGPAPPSYTETVEGKAVAASQDAKQDGQDEVQARLLAAVRKALTTSSSGEEASSAGISPAKLAALLNGSAKLVLVDAETGEAL